MQKGRFQKSETELKIKPHCLTGGNEGVRVRLFATYEDYAQIKNAIRDEYSSGDNPVHFTGLESKVYYFHLFKGVGGSMTSNSYCEDSPGHTPPEYYQTDGSLSSSQVQELEINLCY